MLSGCELQGLPVKHAQHSRVPRTRHLSLKSHRRCLVRCWTAARGLRSCRRIHFAPLGPKGSPGLQLTQISLRQNKTLWRGEIRGSEDAVKPANTQILHTRFATFNPFLTMNSFGLNMVREKSPVPSRRNAFIFHSYGPRRPPPAKTCVRQSLHRPSNAFLISHIIAASAPVPNCWESLMQLDPMRGFQIRCRSIDGVPPYTRTPNVVQVGQWCPHGRYLLCSCDLRR